MKSSGVEALNKDLLRFDEMYMLTLPDEYFNKFQKLAGSRKRKNADSRKRLVKMFAEQLESLISNYFDQSRISSVAVRVHPNTANQEHDEDNNSHRFVLGLTFGDKWADPIMRGPQANTEEGRKFREDFGDLSEIRKFVDNALCESVCWVTTDENNFPNDKSEASIIERYLRFVCYKKLSLPDAALQKFFVLPNKWISIIPRGLLSPMFLQNSFHDLAKILRKITVMKVGIVGINCVSSYYRDTEPFRLRPAPVIWGRPLIELVLLNLPENEKIPPYLPTIKVFITLERTSQWGKDRFTIEGYKLAYYFNLADQCSVKYHINAYALSDSAYVFFKGVVFKIVVLDDYELQSNQERALEFSTERSAYSNIMNAHEATVCQQLQSVSQRFTAFGETCQVAKRWLAALNLSEELNEIAVELLVSKCFLEPSGRSINSLSPMSVTAGFFQFLHLLASHNFLEEPVFVDINESFKDEDRERIRREFLKHRPVLPCVCISTPEDQSGICYTSESPEPIIMCRLIKIAQQAVWTLNTSLSKQTPINYRQLCVADNSVYDFVVYLHDDKRTHFVSNNKFIPSVNQPFFKKSYRTRELRLPVTDFDVTKRLIKEYREKLGNYAIFFYNKYQAKRIFVLLKKRFRSPNKRDMLEYSKSFRSDAYSIQLRNALKSRLSELGLQMVKSISENAGHAEVKAEEKPTDNDAALKHVEPVIKLTH